MALWKELWGRRVPHLLLAYAGGIWAITEVVSFSVQRYGLADAWVDRVLAAGIALLPAAAWFLWRVGAEGPMHWRVRDGLVILGNLALAGVVLAQIPAAPPDPVTSTTVAAPEQKQQRKPTVLIGPVRTADPDPTAQDIAFALPVLIETDLMFDEGLVAQSFVSQGARGATAVLAASGVKDPRAAEAGAWRPIARMQRRDALVLGELGRAPDGWQLDLKLLRFQPKETVEQVRVTSQDPIALVDLASAAVGSALRLEDHPVNDDPPLALSTSESWTVLHDYAVAREVHELQVRPADAIRLYDGILAKSPTFAQARSSRLSALFAVGQYDMARSALTELIRHIDQLPRLQRFQVQLYEARSKRDKAAEIGILELWAQTDPDAPEPRFALDWAHYRRDGNPELLDSLVATAERAATVDNLLQVSQLFDERDDADRARAIRAEAMTRAPNESQAYLLQARADERLGLLDDAERHYRKVLALEPNNRQPALGFSRIRFSRGDFDGAIAETRAMLGRSTHAGSRIESTAQLANQLQNLGREREALAAWRELWASTAKDLSPSDRINQIEAFVSDAIATTEGFAAAERYIDDTIVLDDPKAQAFYRIQLRFRAALAAEDYPKAHELLPQITEAYRSLGNQGTMPSEPYADYIAFAARPDDTALVDRMLETDARFKATLYTGELPVGRFESFRGYVVSPLIRAGRLDVVRTWLDGWLVRSPKAPVLQLWQADWMLASRRPDEARAALASIAAVVAGADPGSALRVEHDRLLAAIEAGRGP